MTGGWFTKTTMRTRVERSIVTIQFDLPARIGGEAHALGTSNSAQRFRCLRGCNIREAAEKMPDVRRGYSASESLTGPLVASSLRTLMASS
jgi:hypothetical protein